MKLSDALTFGSLFAGIGGLDLGLERAGMECVWQVEIDDYCTKVLEKHWPSVTKHKDVRDVGKENLEPVDLIAGGFPCQPHSVAGKRRGAADDRNLWPEFIRVIRETRPRYVLAENVPGIITTYLDTVLSDLEGEGYSTWPFSFSACGFDAPHRRERIFIVAYCVSADGGGGEAIGEGNGQGRRVTKAERESLQPRDREAYSSISQSGSQDVADTNEKGLQNRRKGIARRSQSSPDGSCQSWWTVEPAMGELVDGVSDRLVRFRGRVATGIPNRVNKLRGLGNAVVPAVAQYIGERIIEHAKETWPK